MTATSSYKWEGDTHKVPSRDTQRQKVYTAERAAFGKDFSAPLGDGSMRAVEQFVRKVEASQTWNTLLAKSGLTPLRDGLELKDGRRTRIARGGRYHLSLPRWARTAPVILHEMAHAGTGPAAQHNWPFAAAFLILVGRFIGAEARDRLKAEFKKHKVKFTPPRKFSPEHLAKLKAQGYRLAAARGQVKPEPGTLTPEMIRAGTVLFRVKRDKHNPYTVVKMTANRSPKPDTYRNDGGLTIGVGRVGYGGSVRFDPTMMFLSEAQAQDRAAELNRAWAAEIISAADQQELIAKAARGVVE